MSYRRDRGDEFFISLDTYYDAIFLSKPSDDFTPEYVKDTRDQFELGKAYYQATLGSVDIKVGRQINIWGEAENVRVVDVINPIDSREIAMVDLESLRLPVGAAFASFYKGHWSLEAGVIWEFREDKMPVYGSDFSPLEQPPPPDEKPDPGEELGYTLAVRGILGGGDIGFYYADARHHQSVFDLEKRKMIYPEFEMMGASYARVSGSWVWRAELAYLEDVYEPGLSVANNRWDAMVGAEYYGSHNNTVTLEYAQRRYLDEESKQWGIRRKRDEIVCRYSQSFMREKLALNAFVLADSISDDSLLSRISITYKPADGWSTEFGGVIYQSDYSESYISVVDDNDRVYWRVRYDF